MTGAHSVSSPPHSLDARYYTDPAVFGKERDGLFSHTWQFAGHASSLKNPGDFFTFEIAGQSFFCVRDLKGEVRAFYNVCQHRAHELLHGAGNAKILICPYHAWGYELNGQFRGGPNTQSVPNFDRSKICLSPIKTEIFCGFVFVNRDPYAKPMDDWFPNVRRELTEFVPNIEHLAPLLSVEIPERCNWKVSVENYSECYHCSLNHKTFATGVIRPETYDIQPQGYCLRHTTKCQNLDKMSYPVDLHSNARAGEYSSWFLWPTFSFQVYPGNVLNTYYWQVRDAENVTVWRGWYTADGGESEVIRRLAAQDRSTTVEEDIRIVEAVQRGLKSPGYRPGPLVIDPKGGVNSEHSIRVLQGWMREAIGQI